MEPFPTFVGINVSRTQLNINLYPSEAERLLPNTDATIASLVTELQNIHLRAIAVDSTGGDQWPVVRALLEAMLPVLVVNPPLVRDFAMSNGLLLKSDVFSVTNAIEARMLARFAANVRVSV